MDYTNLGIILMTFAGCLFFFIMTKKGKIKPFLPKFFGKQIDYATPRYYDLQGNLINENIEQPTIEVPPTIDVPQPIPPIRQVPIIEKRKHRKKEVPTINLNADTTATIITQSKEVQATIQVPPIEVPQATLTEDKNYIMYCMKCKAKQQIINISIKKYDTAKGIKYFANGTCSVCGHNKVHGFIKG